MAALLELLPELGLALILFGFVVSYCAGRGLLVMWQNTFGWMLLGIAGFLNYSKSVFHVHIGFDFGHVFVAANNGVVNRLEAWIKTSEEGMARTIRAMTAVAEAGIKASEWLARETAQTFEWLVHVHLPRWAKVALFPVLWPILLPKILRALLPHIRTLVIKPVKVIERAIPQKVVQVFKFAGAAALPGVLGLPHIRADIRGLTRRWARIERRLRRMEALLGVTGLAIAMANVLGLPNWRCLTRGNVGRVARHLCGLPARAIEDLLGLLVDLYVLQHVCDLLTLMEQGFSLIEPEITALVDAAGDMFAHCQYDLPPDPDGTFLSLPPVGGLALSLP